jgi:putative endopeptidase
MNSAFWISLRICFVAVIFTSPAFAAERAQIGDYGFDSTGMDLSVRPSDDFNAYANGAWVKRTDIPGDHAA